jgi:uncharacterized membrane protein
MDLSLIKFLGRSLLDGVHFHHRWMVWNLFLALIPFFLSVPLFRPDWIRQQSSFLRPLQGHLPGKVIQADPSMGRQPVLLDPPTSTAIWWLGAFAFVAFLPNAPYVLTDVIHMIRAIQQEPSMWVSAFVWVPVFLVFMFIGFEAYVISLINLGYFLHKRGLGNWITGVEISLHALSAIGVYLGRFLRFNSWDIVTNPGDLFLSVVDELTGQRPILAMIFSFVILSLLYLPSKEVTLAVAAYRKVRRIQRILDGAVLE